MSSPEKPRLRCGCQTPLLIGFSPNGPQSVACPKCRGVILINQLNPDQVNMVLVEMEIRVGRQL